MFNEKMKKENRNAIILFLDNDTCHPKVTISDMGVIYTFKLPIALKH
jgi:hypothetical protein